MRRYKWMNIMIEDNGNVYEKFSVLFLNFTVLSLSLSLSLPVHAINIKIVLTRRRDRDTGRGRDGVGKWGKICVNWEIYFADLRALHSIKGRDGVTTAPKSMHTHTHTHAYQYTQIGMISSGRTPGQNQVGLGGGGRGWLSATHI